MMSYEYSLVSVLTKNIEHHNKKLKIMLWKSPGVNFIFMFFYVAF